MFGLMFGGSDKGIPPVIEFTFIVDPNEEAKVLPENLIF